MDIAHNVICLYCHNKFDRDKEKYAKVGTKRYAHAACALQEAETSGKEVEIIDPTAQVLCQYCQKPVCKNDEDCVKLSETRFAHKACKEADDKRPKTSQEEFEIYVQNIFDLEYILPSMQKQIKKYIEKYNFSYSGMQKALDYFINVKKGVINTSVRSLGIIPYVYQEAYDYYYHLWEAQKKNKEKEIVKPKIKIVKARRPQVKTKKLNLFSFLDEEN